MYEPIKRRPITHLVKVIHIARRLIAHTLHELLQLPEHGDALSPCQQGRKETRDRAIIGFSKGGRNADRVCVDESRHFIPTYTCFKPIGEFLSTIHGALRDSGLNRDQPICGECAPALVDAALPRKQLCRRSTIYVSARHDNPHARTGRRIHRPSKQRGKP